MLVVYEFMFPGRQAIWPIHNCGLSFLVLRGESEDVKIHFAAVESAQWFNKEKTL